MTERNPCPICGDPGEVEHRPFCSAPLPRDRPRPLVFRRLARCRRWNRRTTSKRDDFGGLTAVWTGAFLVLYKRASSGAQVAQLVEHMTENHGCR